MLWIEMFWVISGGSFEDLHTLPIWKSTFYKHIPTTLAARIELLVGGEQIIDHVGGTIINLKHVNHIQCGDFQPESG